VRWTWLGAPPLEMDVELEAGRNLARGLEVDPRVCEFTVGVGRDSSSPRRIVCRLMSDDQCA
jgi:hypothetical protein